VFFDNLVVQHYTGPLSETTDYTAWGLDMKMISSKAFGRLENKRKYNGIEYEYSFDLIIGETFFRTHNPQTGRWWQIDPKIDGMVNWSPYAANFNNPIAYSDPRGDWPGWMKKIGRGISNVAGKVWDGVAGVAEGAWGAVKDVGHMVTHPWQTIKNTWHAVTHPWQTIKGIGQAIGNTWNKFMDGDIRGGFRDLTRTAGSIWLTKKVAEAPKAALESALKSGMAASIVMETEMAAAISNNIGHLNGVNATVNKVIGGKDYVLGFSNLVENGVLETAIEMKNNSGKYLLPQGDLTGTDVFNRLFFTTAMNGGIIKTIRGSWNAGGHLKDNIEALNNAILQGVPAEAAALNSTFTGKMAKLYGYTNVSINKELSKLNADNLTYRKLVVDFNLTQ
jgi:RHS repeat-associated protein